MEESPGCGIIGHYKRFCKGGARPRGKSNTGDKRPGVNEVKEAEPTGEKESPATLNTVSGRWLLLNGTNGQGWSGGTGALKSSRP